MGLAVCGLSCLPVLMGELLMAPQREEPGVRFLNFIRQSRQRVRYNSRENNILAWGKAK